MWCNYLNIPAAFCRGGLCRAKKNSSKEKIFRDRVRQNSGQQFFYVGTLPRDFLEGGDFIGSRVGARGRVRGGSICTKKGNHVVKRATPDMRRLPGQEMFCIEIGTSLGLTLHLRVNGSSTQKDILSFAYSGRIFCLRCTKALFLIRTRGENIRTYSECSLRFD